MPPPLYAMHTCFYHLHGRHAARTRAQMLADLGYAGTTWTLWDQTDFAELPGALDELDALRLKLATLYTFCDVHTGTTNPRLEEALRVIAGRNIVLELGVRSSGEHDKPSSPRADQRAADLVNRICDLAAPHGVRVSFYPHKNFWLERVEDAVRLGMRINRPELGVTFNLIHWLGTDGQQLPARLDLAMPRLYNVTINGARHDIATGWTPDIAGSEGKAPPAWSIEPLDAGTFDISYFLGALLARGYDGPLTVTHWGVFGDAYRNLQRSINAYREVTARLTKRPHWSQLQPHKSP